MHNTSIKFWAEDDRPREKFALKGRSSLSNAELLAIIINTGQQDISALEIAQNILQDVQQDINMLAKKSVADLMKYKGIGNAKAITLATVFEIARRKESTEQLKQPVITKANDVYVLLKPFLADLCHEEFYVVFLSRKNAVIGLEQISKGGLSGTIADGKIIFKRAIETNASSIILAHNHPSGNLNPSEQDKLLTKNLCQFGKFIDLPVLDHLIFTDNGYFSFSEKSLI